MKKHVVSMIMAFMALSTMGFGENSDIVIEDFEGDTYGNWRPVGGAFGSGPCKDPIADGVMGQGYASSRGQGNEPDCCRATGDLVGRAFQIERDYINFLVGGGAPLGGRESVNL